MTELPTVLGTGPFTRQTARAHGVSDRMLQGSRFVRVFPRVWRLADSELGFEDLVTAASMALPAAARTTGITRIQLLGLDFGPRRPLHFVMEGELHLDLEGVFLHRTKKLAPCAGPTVTPAAAYLSYVARARVIDALKVGDWLLHHGHMTLDELESLALSALWRDGALEALWLLEHLEPRSRSLKETETSGLLVFAGLLRPESNATLDVGGVALTPDLLYRAWGPLVLEYEGAHHQEDRVQYVSDIDRYRLYRDAEVPYLQVTTEHLQRPRRFVDSVHLALAKLGYDGPAPTYGEQWRLLFARVSVVVGPRRRPIQR